MCSLQSTDVRMEPNDLRRPERVENFRRSVAMLPPGAPALNREEAVQVFAALIDALLEVRQRHTVDRF